MKLVTPPLAGDIPGGPVKLCGGELFELGAAFRLEVNRFVPGCGGLPPASASM